MKILLINHYAGTPELGMEYRPYYLAREWVRMGHQVLVLAASHSHVRSRQPQAGGQTIDGIAYCWYETPPTRAMVSGACAISGPSAAMWPRTPTSWPASSRPMW